MGSFGVVINDKILQVATVNASCFQSEDSEVVVIRHPHRVVFYRLSEDQLTENNTHLRLIHTGQAYFEQSTILFRQSPFNASEFVVLTEDSNFFRLRIPQ